MGPHPEGLKVGMSDILTLYVGHGGQKISYPIVGMTVTFDKNIDVGQMSDKFLHFVAMADKKWTQCRMSAALGGAPFKD